MSGEVISKKRAARIERRKAKMVSLFNLETDASSSLNPPDNKKPRLSDEEYQELRKRLRERKRALTQLPLFRLVELGLNASLNVAKDSRVPIMASDLQSLLMYSIVGDAASYNPFRWCKLDKWVNLTHTVVVAVNNIGVDDFENNQELFPEICKIFQDQVEVSNPLADSSSLAQELAYVPVSNSAKKRLSAGYKTLKDALKAGVVTDILSLESSNKNKVDSSNTPASEEEQGIGSNKVVEQENESKEEKELEELVEEKPTKEKESSYNRLNLLLSADQLVAEHYPVPGIELYKNFKYTKAEYKPVTKDSAMFSLDCEWCLCQGGAKGLARIAVVDESLKVVYHSFVKPKLKVVDYLTKYSGITPNLLKSVKTTLEDVQTELELLLPPDAIIVGQTVSADLMALRMMHPYIIDTSVIYNLTGHRRRKSKLSLLTQTFLGEQIQMSADGHNPIEDSIAAMKLVLLKLEKGLSFGDALMSSPKDWCLSRPDFLQQAVNYEFENTAQTSTDADELIIDPNTFLYTKLFTFIQSHNKAATLIATSELVPIYEPKIEKLPTSLIKKRKEEDLVQSVQIHVVDNLKSAVETARFKVYDYHFTLIHVDFNCSSENREKQLKKLDRYIGKVFGSISMNGMMVVIFSGPNDSSKNGACFVRINKPKIN